LGMEHSGAVMSRLKLKELMMRNRVRMAAGQGTFALPNMARIWK
jgi:hypothetical protein